MSQSWEVRDKGRRGTAAAVGNSATHRFPSRLSKTRRSKLLGMAFTVLRSGAFHLSNRAARGFLAKSARKPARQAEAPAPPPLTIVSGWLNATDTLLIVPHFPAYAGKVPFEEEHLSPGGQVASALVACARLGLRTKY